MKYAAYVTLFILMFSLEQISTFDDSSSEEEENNSELEAYICSFCRGIPLYTEIVLNRYSGLTTDQQIDNGSDIVEQLITIDEMNRLLFSYIYDYVTRRQMIATDDQTEANFIVSTEAAIDELLLALKRFRDDILKIDDNSPIARAQVTVRRQVEISNVLRKFNAICSTITADIIRNTNKYDGV